MLNRRQAIKSTLGAIASVATIKEAEASVIREPGIMSGILVNVYDGNGMLISSYDEPEIMEIDEEGAYDDGYSDGYEEGWKRGYFSSSEDYRAHFEEMDRKLVEKYKDILLKMDLVDVDGIQAIRYTPVDPTQYFIDLLHQRIGQYNESLGEGFDTKFHKLKRNRTKMTIDDENDKVMLTFEQIRKYGLDDAALVGEYDEYGTLWLTDIRLFRLIEKIRMEDVDNMNIITTRSSYASNR
jgi:hypothetical protein